MFLGLLSYPHRRGSSVQILNPDGRIYQLKRQTLTFQKYYEVVFDSQLLTRSRLAVGKSAYLRLQLSVTRERLQVLKIPSSNIGN